MDIIIMAAFGVLLAFLLVRFGPLARKKEAEANSTAHRNRIGDGLRRLEANKKKYAVMTKPLLDETPDEDLIEAVLSGLWAKMKPDMSDALEVIQAQSKERQHIFALYAITGGVKQAGFDKIKACPDKVLLPVALEALERLDMPESIAALRSAIEAAQKADQYNTPYSDAFDAEDGKDKMAHYVRSHPEGFLDLA